MSVVIVGGHDRMVSQYKKICKEHKCKAKVFTQMSANLSSQIGSPIGDLFTNTVSHKWRAVQLLKPNVPMRILSDATQAARLQLNEI